MKWATFGWVVLTVFSGAVAAENAEKLYEQAKTAALQDNRTEAVELLRRSFEAGHPRPSAVLSDPAFEKLREDRSFRGLLRRHAREHQAHIVTPGEPGERLIVEGQVVDQSGNPVANALVYLYQTDHHGKYSAVGSDNRNPRLYAYLRTDSQGRFELSTVRPGGYPQSRVAQHIHYEIDLPGGGRHVAEFLFDDDERLGESAREQASRRGWPVVTTSRDAQGRQRCAVEIRVP